MTAKIIDGREIARGIRTDLKQKTAEYFVAPMLAVILAGNNPASEIYVRAKEKACGEAGIATRTFRFSALVTQDELLNLIVDLNKNPEINGILVQLPLPEGVDASKILSAISPLKDVDGFHPLNAGLTVQKNPKAFVPCTPKGIIRLLKSVREDLSGLNAVVIGRSQIVGLPTAHLLINENCTVTVAHSRTKHLSELCRTADILVCAVGQAEFVTKEYIKPGALVIDVGINRTPDGLKGDVCFDEVREIASYITPVPGGVGPMTIAMLLENTFEAFLKQRLS